MTLIYFQSLVTHTITFKIISFKIYFPFLIKLYDKSINDKQMKRREKLVFLAKLCFNWNSNKDEPEMSRERNNNGFWHLLDEEKYLLSSSFWLGAFDSYLLCDQQYFAYQNCLKTYIPAI